MIRTQIQLTEEQSRQVKEVAQREDISMAEVIRRAVDHWLHTQGGTNIRERHRLALVAASEMDGMFHSGCSDISENHDVYLAEAASDYESRTDLS